MPRAHARQVKYAWEKMPVARVDEIPPVQNTWYTMLDDEEDVRIPYIWAFQEHDEAGALNIEVRLTIDGDVYTALIAAADDTLYMAYLRLDTPDGDDELVLVASTMPAGSSDADQGFEIFGHLVKVEIRLTGVPGTNQELRGKVMWYQLNGT